VNTVLFISAKHRQYSYQLFYFFQLKCQDNLQQRNLSTQLQRKKKSIQVIFVLSLFRWT